MLPRIEVSEAGGDNVKGGSSNPIGRGRSTVTFPLCLYATLAGRRVKFI